VILPPIPQLKEKVLGFIEAKRQYTALLTRVVELMNARRPYSEIVPVMQDMIPVYDKMTDNSNGMEPLVWLIESKGVVIENLPDVLAKALYISPVDDYCAAYCVLLNTICMCPDKPLADGCAAALNSDIKRDIDYYYNTVLPDPEPEDWTVRLDGSKHFGLVVNRPIPHWIETGEWNSPEDDLTGDPIDDAAIQLRQRFTNALDGLNMARLDRLMAEIVRLRNELAAR
jgi:hypothetical protein